MTIEKDGPEDNDCGINFERDASAQSRAPIGSDHGLANNSEAKKPEPGERMFLDKHTPEGLFDPRTDCGRALITGSGDNKVAIFFDGPGPKFRQQELTDEKIAFGRWWPLHSIIGKGNDEGVEQIGTLEIDEGIVRMLMLSASGQASWEAIGITESDDGFIDDYDIIAEGWKEPFASRNSADEHETGGFEKFEPLYSSFLMVIEK